MKEEIEKLNVFLTGVENPLNFNEREKLIRDNTVKWMQFQYNGISPSTVTEMIEALSTIKTLTMRTGDKRLDFLSGIAENVLSKADKEIKK